jgi:hypothetical protein
VVCYFSYANTCWRAAECLLDVYYEYVFGSSACTQFITDSESTTYFCLNLPKSVISRFANDIKRDPHLASFPFSLDVLIADEVINQWQRDMQKQRSALKQLVSDLGGDQNLVPVYAKEL